MIDGEEWRFSLEKFVINGGCRLCGEVTVSGAKNAAVAIIPAAMLADDICIIENVPAISDVSAIIDIMSQMGVDIRLVNKSTLRIDSRNIHTAVIPYEMAKHLRASYYLSELFWDGLARRWWQCPAVVIWESVPLTSILRALKRWAQRSASSGE